jgi:hypothetical protein
MSTMSDQDHNRGNKHGKEDSQQRPPAALPASRLEKIWEDHLRHFRKIDALERRIDEHAIRLRRRVANLLDTAPTHRLSHLRLFVSHHERNAASEHFLLQHGATTKSTGEAAAASDQLLKKWTLVLEGRLLVGHLDHESAHAFDERLRREFQQRHKVSANHPSMPQATSASTSSTVPTEEEDPIEPIQFTHFFDKLVVHFQSIYQPIITDSSVSPSTNTSAAAALLSSPAPTTPKGSSSKKKSRSAKRQKTAAAAAVEAALEGDSLDPRVLTYSEPSEFAWNKTITTLSGGSGDARNNPSSYTNKPASVTTSVTTKDAHAFFVHYDSQPPPDPTKQLYGVVATAQLYPARGPEQRYKPSKEFAKVFFPKHIEQTVPPVLPSIQIAEAAKKAGAAGDQEGEDGTNTTPKSKKRSAAAQPPPEVVVSLENEIHVPTSLTMKEITFALFTYIQDHKLSTEDDPTLIQNDATLQKLFECETMRFYEIQSLLMQNKLILLLPKPAPIVLKYVIKESEEGAESSGADGDADALAAPLTMDLHNDVYVPNLFPYRARECLRRIKRRELEYTSSRTKARYLIMASRAKDESSVKTKLEQAICGSKQLGQWPILACLAKAAPPHSEARTTVTLDAKIAYLLQQVEHAQLQAAQAWELVDLCRTMGATEEDNNEDEEEDDQKQPAVEEESPSGEAEEETKI